MKSVLKNIKVKTIFRFILKMKVWEKQPHTQKINWFLNLKETYVCT